MFFSDGANQNIAAENYFRTIKDLSLITKEDVAKPRYIFDRNSEIAKNTLGEAIISRGYTKEYMGHWIDREYLNTSDYNTLLGTWVHEICHKSGGDGTPDFTYALTDMLRVLLNSKNSTGAVKLKALNEAFEEISK